MKVHFLQTIKRHFYDIFPCWYSWSLMMRSVSLSPHRYQHVEIIAGPHPLQHHPLCCRAEAKVNPNLSKIHSYFFLIKTIKAFLIRILQTTEAVLHLDLLDHVHPEDVVCVLHHQQHLHHHRLPGQEEESPQHERWGRRGWAAQPNGSNSKVVLITSEV